MTPRLYEIIDNIPEKDNAWRLDKMRAAAIRAYKNRRTYAIGSRERIALTRLVESIRRGYRTAVANGDLAYCTFTFESHAAQQITEQAEARGVAPSVIIQEIWQHAFWRYGVKSQIKILTREDGHSAEVVNSEEDDYEYVTDFLAVHVDHIKSNGIDMIRFSLNDNGFILGEADYPSTVTLGEANAIMDAFMSRDSWQ